MVTWIKVWIWILFGRSSVSDVDCVFTIVQFYTHKLTSSWVFCRRWRLLQGHFWLNFAPNDWKRKKKELWQKILKKKLSFLSLSAFNLGEDRKDHLLSPSIVYPIPSAKHVPTQSSKGGCSNQAATGYFCRLVTALQQGSAKGHSVWNVLHFWAQQFQPKLELSSKISVFSPRFRFPWATVGKTNAAHLWCRATGLNANSREALTFIQFKCHSSLSWYSPTIIHRDIRFLTHLGSGAMELFYTFRSRRLHTQRTALVIYLYFHTGRHQNQAQGLCWVK